MELSDYFLGICSAVYATLGVLIAFQARQTANMILAGCCGLTAVWAAYGVFWSQPMIDNGPGGFLDLSRLLIWYSYLLYLYQRSNVGSTWQIRGFGLVVAGALAVGVTITCTRNGALTYTLFSLPIAIRLLVCVCELLLIENLYLNLPESARWHIAMPCVLLGGLACFDILVIADTVLYRRPSIPLTSGRAIVMIIVAPLLVVAAFRGQRWSEPIRLSRAAVFHSATLVLSGSVLLLLALIGQILRHVDETWGWIAELCLIFLGLMGIMLFLSSRTARSLLDQIVVHHFFADRFDYRMEWLACIATLSGKRDNERSDLRTRAIQAVADIVNSPCGSLFIRDDVTGSMVWASSWNMPPSADLPSLHPLIQVLSTEQKVVDLCEVRSSSPQPDPLAALGPVWLAVPLMHSSGINGLVIVGPPRVVFRIDQEVFDLLGILGQEVGTFIAEQRAAEVISQTRSLHDYGKRFAFVAHDIKNVASQLTLLLSNAEYHLDNPEFQRDMLETVRSSVQKIDRLIKRLDEPRANMALASIIPVPRLESLLAAYQRTHNLLLTLEHDGFTGHIAVGVEAFETAITHLLNNAVDAAPTKSILISVEHKSERVIIDITDLGQGMSPEFIRDELFSPFKTLKRGGSGIGAFQARELINEAGGELLVLSQQGVGTTMRILFRNIDEMSFVPSETFS